MWLTSSLVCGSPHLQFRKLKNEWSCATMHIRRTWKHLRERWLAAWLFCSWFCTDHRSAKMHCQEQKFRQEREDAEGGRACAVRFSYQITVLDLESVRSSMRYSIESYHSSLLSWNDDGSFFLTIYQNYTFKLALRIASLIWKVHVRVLI